MMSRGAIVLVRFPFTDYTSSKLRPAVVISTENERDVCVAFISSVIPGVLEPADFVLQELDEGFKETRLKKDSVFRMKKIATLDTKIIVGRLGKVSPRIQKELDKKLRLSLGLG